MQINENQAAIDEIYQRVFGSSDESPQQMKFSSTLVIDNDEALIEKAMNAANGDKFRRLWEGNWEADYASQSEADLALCSMLAFWTQGEPARIDSLFRQSGLMREKWDEPRGEETYGAMTISKAINSCENTYDRNYLSGTEQRTSSNTNKNKTEATDTQEEDTKPEPSATLPFPRSAFRGIFEMYLEAVKGRNEVCDAYHFAVLKTALGSIIGRGAYLYTGSRTYANFYSCLIGMTGISRKTTALGMGREVLERIDPNVITFGGLATPEGLIAKLTVDSTDDDEDKDGSLPNPTMQARIDATSEYEGFRAFVGLSEYAALLKKAKKSSSDGLIQVLTDAYDCPPTLDNPTRNSPLRAVNPCISIVALSTQDWLEGSLNLEDIRGGFANRFCYYLHELTPPIPRPMESDENLLSAVVQTVHKIRQYYQGRHVAFDFDNETGIFVDQWYAKNREAILNEKNELVRDTMQRLDTNARKLALLYAVLENGEGDHHIHLEQFKAALEVATYWQGAMQQIFGLFAKDEQTKNENVIIERLRKKSRTKRELRMSTSRQIHNSKQFNDALDALIKAERVGESGGKLVFQN